MKKRLKDIRMKEEAPVNSIASGNIAELTGDPPVSLVTQKRHIRKSKILRRKKQP